MVIDPGSKILFIGDSITDCGRSQPVGTSLGNGYVGTVSGLLGAIYPEAKFRLLNMGASGNTVRDLESRWVQDVVQHSPDWPCVMIGINDVWRQFDSPLAPEAAVDLETYDATLTRLVGQTRPSLQGLVLMSPFYIEPLTTDAMRARMDEYRSVVRAIAAQHNAIFVDVQKAFDQSLLHFYPATLAWDRVHPNVVGHTIIAKAWLDAVQFDWHHSALS